MSVKNKTNKNYKRSQKGRSMVEMLGVLAIVGVLSVGGVYGYGVAMKKHKANELLHQASMLATTISAQIQSKGELPQSIEDFGNGKYGTFNPPREANAEQFTMQITGMDSAVCTQMEKMASGMVREAKCNGTTLTLTYNNNLSSDKVAADYNGDETGGSCTGAGYKWCSELSTPACKKDCCSGVTLNSCQESCDSSTGEITNEDDGTECITADGKIGACEKGNCIIEPQLQPGNPECSVSGYYGLYKSWSTLERNQYCTDEEALQYGLECYNSVEHTEDSCYKTEAEAKEACANVRAVCEAGNSNYPGIEVRWEYEFGDTTPDREYILEEIGAKWYCFCYDM
ncbi:MAG: type II secretion system protein [Alphaproteobacteria bacterium]|nr:type II secretion system protein [Alphaproteobacteria bacterium]